MKPSLPPVIARELGDPNESMVNQHAALLEPGDILIDGGNSYYTFTENLLSALRQEFGGHIERHAAGK